MNAQVSWEPIAQLAARVRVPAATGRKPYPALAMLKGLYLQSAYDLGDQEMEEALARPLLVPPLLRLLAGREHARRDHHLALPRGGVAAGFSKRRLARSIGSSQPKD